MKKRKFIRLFLIVIVLSLCISPVAQAQTQASAYLHSYLAYVHPEGDGKVSVWFGVQAIHTMDEVGAITVRLREKAPGESTWTPVKTFFYTDYPDMLGTNVAHYDGHVDYQGKEGYSYFAYVTVWAGDDGDGDSRIIATEPVVAK